MQYDFGREKNVSLKFETDSSNFSPNSIDVGTLAMLSAVEFLPDDKILDMGCGYVIVGILAVKLSKKLRRKQGGAPNLCLQR